MEIKTEKDDPFNIPKWASEIRDQYADIVHISENKFIVFIDKDFEIDWKTSTEYDKELENIETAWEKINTIDSEIRLLYTKIPSFFSKKIKLLLAKHIGEATVAALRNNKEQADKILNDAEHRISYFLPQESRKQVLSICLILLVIQLFILCIIQYFAEIFSQKDFIISSILGGIGSLLSIVMKTAHVDIDNYLTSYILNIEVIFKVITGMIFSVLLFLMIKAGIFPLANGNVFAIYVFSFIAGFTERFVPSLIDKNVIDNLTK